MCAAHRAGEAADQESPPDRRLLTDGPVRRAIVTLAARARADWGFATAILATGFREAHLGQAERRLVAEAVYGQIRLHRRIDHALGFGLRPTGRTLDDLPPGERDLARHLAWLVIAGGFGPDEVAAVAPGRVAPALRALARERQALAAVGDPQRRAAIELSYPDWILARFVGEVGLGEARRLCAAMNERAPLTVRANTVRTSRRDLARRLAAEGVETEPTALAAYGLRFARYVNAFGLAAFRDGLFEVQDEGSQLVAEACAPPPRGLVVDACAGAGGKTLALAALCGGRGRVVALDVDGRKLEELRRRARRAGLSSVQARAPGPAATLGLLGRADRVLCDAPCSGLGVLRRNPEARWRLTPDSVAELPARQLGILEQYAGLCAPGGRLVYATCTVLRSENDDVVEAFLAAHPAFERVLLKEILGAARALELGDGTCLRLYPHRHGTDGFFAAVLRRRG
ncbi:MAG: RNA methyltransferase [Deltaproteobacteria bacterium]|nr:RNA methyltransferase [Deltaproteobacteria bacterium]